MQPSAGHHASPLAKEETRIAKTYSNTLKSRECVDQPGVWLERAPSGPPIETERQLDVTLAGLLTYASIELGTPSQTVTVQWLPAAAGPALLSALTVTG